MRLVVKYSRRLALWSICGCLLVTLQLGQSRLVRASQAQSAGSEKFADGLKWLGTVMDGASARVARPGNGYDAYKYEAFQYEGCEIGWIETRESFGSDAPLLKETQSVRVPLALLDQASVREDKVGKSAYVVSFTTLNQKTEIRMRLLPSAQESNESLGLGLASGAGVYFESAVVAKRMANTLIRSINYCQKEKPLE